MWNGRDESNHNDTTIGTFILINHKRVHIPEICTDLCAESAVYYWVCCTVQWCHALYECAYGLVCLGFRVFQEENVQQVKYEVGTPTENENWKNELYYK